MRKEMLTFEVKILIQYETTEERREYTQDARDALTAISVYGSLGSMKPMKAVLREKRQIKVREVLG